MLFNDNIAKASASRQPKFDEIDFEDPNKERDRRNVSHFVLRNQSTESNDYK